MGKFAKNGPSFVSGKNGSGNLTPENQPTGGTLRLKQLEENVFIVEENPLESEAHLGGIG